MKRCTVLITVFVMGCPGDDGPAATTATGSSGGATSNATGSGTGETSDPTGMGPATATVTGSTSSTTGADSSGSATETTGGAIPGEYEGYGAMTMGADSCPEGPEEIHVTSLDDDGPGTLREALSSGCRRIVFEMGGTITLESDLNIPYSYITIDGSSAPEPGITIVQPDMLSTTIEASGSIGEVHDIIIHHLRMDGMAVEHLNQGDIWGLDGEAAPVHDIIIDHVTAGSAADGVFDIWEGVSNVTLSWNIIHGTITALHLSTGSLDNTRERISLHHNVFSGNNERQIRLRHNSLDVDYRNNVIHGWGWFEGGAAGLHIAYDEGETNPSINVVGNTFLYVEGLFGNPEDAIVFESGADVGTVYFDGNALPAEEVDAVSTGVELAVPEWAQVTMYASDELDDMVVPNVGTHFPTVEEMQLLDDVAAASP